MSQIYSKTTKGLLWLGEEPQIPVPTVSPEQSLAVDQLLKDADEVLAKVSKDMITILKPSDPDFGTWMSWSTLPPPAPDYSAMYTFRITRTTPCVWHNDNSDVETLNLSALASMEDDAVFHAFCLFRLPSSERHSLLAAREGRPGDVPYIRQTSSPLDLYPGLVGPHLDGSRVRASRRLHCIVRARDGAVVHVPRCHGEFRTSQIILLYRDSHGRPRNKRHAQLSGCHNSGSRSHSRSEKTRREDPTRRSGPPVSIPPGHRSTG